MTTAIALILASSAYAGENSCKKEKKAVDEHLAIFDDLDFNVFSNQKWSELNKSHSQDVLVHLPDGTTTKGIEDHIQYLKYMFTYAPDTRIEEHPVKIGQGEWTAVYGIMKGTFTQPMKTPNGIIQPTGKQFNLPMATLGHWKNGTMDEEYLFWDNQTYLKQMGVIK
ncbi:MAG: ester cyclase [Oligoflexia bacterium]|nr:ester cyclase [Oligoflexia bacterium]